MTPAPKPTFARLGRKRLNVDSGPPSTADVPWMQSQSVRTTQVGTSGAGHLRFGSIVKSRSGPLELDRLHEAVLRTPRCTYALQTCRPDG